MNRKVILLGLAVILLVSACGAGEPAVPTTDPNSIINTAQAAAFTMIAETQAAVPTATFTETPIPTPLPTDTPIPPPTLDPAAITPPTATSAANASGDPCYHPIAPNEGGPRSVLRFKNTTNTPVYIFVYLWKQNAHGECGYIGFDLSKGATTTIKTMPQGYFAITAWTKNRTKTAYGEAIISDDHLIDFEIYEDRVRVIYP